MVYARGILDPSNNEMKKEWEILIRLERWDYIFFIQ